MLTVIGLHRQGDAAVAVVDGRSQVTVGTPFLVLQFSYLLGLQVVLGPLFEQGVRCHDQAGAGAGPVEGGGVREDKAEGVLVLALAPPSLLDERGQGKGALRPVRAQVNPGEPGLVVVDLVWALGPQADVVGTGQLVF